MERTQAPENGSGLDLPQPQADNSDGRAGSSAHNENAESTDNLFFRDDDGSVLAVRISCILGRELLCGLSQQTSPLTYFPALPLVSASPAHRDDDGPSATAHIPATLPSGTPTVSTHTSAPARATSAARGGELRPKLSAAIVDTDAWVDGIFSSSNGTSYDRNWISNNDVDDEQVLKGTASKHKLDVLIRYGAVVVGDKLCVTYNLSTNPKTVEGVALKESTSTELCVRIAPPRADFDGILRRIHGPKDLVRGMNKEYAKKYNHAIPEKWSEVRLVSSTGQDIGTLYDVRQAYQVWTDEKAKWVARTSRPAASSL